MSMAKVTLKGNEVNTNSEIVKAGASAPDFILVNSDLGDVSLASYEGKNKIKRGQFWYQSPCPPNGSHNYQWTATASKTKNYSGTVGTAYSSKRYP